MAKKPLITTSKTARVMGCSEAGVRRLVDRGILRAERTESGIRLFDPDEVAKIANSRRQRQEQGEG